METEETMIYFADEPVDENGDFINELTEEEKLADEDDGDFDDFDEDAPCDELTREILGGSPEEDDEYLGDDDMYGKYGETKPEDYL